MLVACCLYSRVHAEPNAFVPQQLPALDPAIELVDLQGKRHHLDEFRGKVVLVNFWASWCPPCIQEMPALQHLGSTIDDPAFQILAVNAGEAKFRVWKFVRLIRLQLPVWLDAHRTLFRAWHARILPTSYLLDRNGTVRYRAEGAPDWDSEDTRTMIRTLLQEKQKS